MVPAGICKTLLHASLDALFLVSLFSSDVARHETPNRLLLSFVTPSLKTITSLKAAAKIFISSSAIWVPLEFLQTRLESLVSGYERQPPGGMKIAKISRSSISDSLEMVALSVTGRGWCS